MNIKHSLFILSIGWSSLVFADNSSTITTPNDYNYGVACLFIDLMQAKIDQIENSDEFKKYSQI